MRARLLAALITVVFMAVGCLGRQADAEPVGPPVSICTTPDNGPTTCTTGQWETGPLPWRTPAATPVEATPRLAG